MSIIIGIPAAVDDEATSSILGTYVPPIERLGGLPLILPYVKDKKTIEQFVAVCDGVFFTGGLDIEPSRYGETKKETCDMTAPLRDELEFAVFEAAFAAKKPMLCICRGLQLINAALGGKLYQDLPTETRVTLSHRQTEEKFEFSHDIVIKKDTPLFSLLNAERIRGNSFHHQAIKELGEGLSVMALSDDGIIEGIYHTSYPYLRAYQWHPERLFEKDESSRLIFADFINACNKK